MKAPGFLILIIGQIEYRQHVDLAIFLAIFDIDWELSINIFCSVGYSRQELEQIILPLRIFYNIYNNYGNEEIHTIRMYGTVGLIHRLCHMNGSISLRIWLKLSFSATVQQSFYSR